MEKVKIIFHKTFNFGQKRLEKNIAELLKRLVRNLWHANIGRSFKSFGSKLEMFSKLCFSIALEIISVIETVCGF